MHRLLVPTDFSDFAQEALRMALTLGQRTGAEVHLLHIVSPTPLAPEELGGVDGPFGGGTHAGGPGEDGTHAALRQQVEFASATAADVVFAIRYAYAVAPEVLTYADEVDADMIVTGTHGRRGLRRMMLGSVAEEVVRTAPCDVLVAPVRSAPFSAHPARRVLVPVDMHEGTTSLLAFARGLSRDLGSEQVDLLHVLEPLPYPVGWLDNAVLDIVPSIRDHAAEALRAEAESAGLGDAGVYIERGKAEEVIGRVADVLDSELIVLAPHQRGRVKRALLGSVAGTVARSAARPVLVARSLVEPEEASGEMEAAPLLL